MKKNSTTHIDCIYYLPIDVFKGLCKRDKSKILADESSCEQYDPAPKCKHCKNFSKEAQQIGKCMDKSIAYPDMIAKTCNDFKWKK